MPTAATGRILAGRYRLISELGVGGMGVTYRAWDDVDAVPVVVKVPKREAQSDEEALRRFAREIDAMLGLPHAHIVPITDHGNDNGCPYVVMRFLPGGSLADHRRRDDNGDPLANPAGMLHFWLPAIAKALDSIHQRGVLHRDVKPGNIFFDGFWNAFLGDFGIAKVVDGSGGLAKEQTLTATMVAIGTPEYMAPELFLPKATPDGRADQYALAVTVYEMVCGAKPFTGSKAHIVVEHSGMQVPPLQTKGPKLPQSLCAAVERALAKTPGERFGTCSEFVREALQDVTPLSPEPDITRLLCPGCKNLLKLPQKAAGRTGRCPKCREPIDVAEDLGSLWLKSEERGAGTVPVKQSLMPLEESPEQASADTIWRWRILALAACCGLVVGYVGGAASERTTMQEEFKVAERRWQKALDEERAKAAAEKADLERRLAALKPPQPKPNPPEMQSIALGESITALINASRQQAGFRNLTHDPRLDTNALSHAEQMGKAKTTLPRAWCLVAAIDNPAGKPPTELAEPLVKNMLEDSKRREWAHAPTHERVGVAAVTVNGRTYFCIQLAQGSSGVAQEVTNSIGGTLKLIPAGTFTMGQVEINADTRPHQVTLTNPYYIGIHEVTNAQWKRVMGSVPSKWKDDVRPVEGVCWEDTVEFCRRLSALPEEKSSGRVYRLPTEAEWEYACRAGTTTVFSFGDDELRLRGFGWFDGNSENQTHPVGQKAPNAWGLFDMHGNVWEWCSDWYGAYPSGDATDPKGLPDASFRVRRGGGWLFTAGSCRSAYRHGHDPSLRSDSLGFRIALSPSLTNAEVE